MGFRGACFVDTELPCSIERACTSELAIDNCLSGLDLHNSTGRSSFTQLHICMMSGLASGLAVSMSLINSTNDSSHSMFVVWIQH